jgi:hypothetical protein
MNFFINHFFITKHCVVMPYSCNAYLQGIAMQFKLFKLKQLYPDLQKYDHRALWGEFGIKGTSVKFSKFMNVYLDSVAVAAAWVAWKTKAPVPANGSGSGPNPTPILCDLGRIQSQPNP